MNRVWLKGGMLEPVQLAFRRSLYGREQAADPISGLRRYGPYEPVDVKILHIIPREWREFLPDELISVLEGQLDRILFSFLRMVSKRVKFERIYVNSVKDVIFGSKADQKKVIEDLLSVIYPRRDSVVLIPLLKSKLGEFRCQKIYAKLKAIGLKEEFVTQMYTDEKTLNSVKSLVGWSSSGSRGFGDAILYNLALNVMAKAGGKPWALYNELDYNVVIGLSWSVKRTIENISTGPTTKYYGVVHTFDNVGTWETFDAFVCETREDTLARALSEAISEIMEQRRYRGGRILIMTREQIKRRLISELSDICSQHSFRLDIAMVGDAKSVRLYNTADPMYLAPRGLYFIASSNRAFLINTGRYKGGKYLGIGVPHSVSVKLIYTSDQERYEALRRVLYAVYALTLMNWRSLWGMLRLPTPIHYSKLVARFFALLSSEDIQASFVKVRNYIYRSEKLRDRLWFL